MESSNSPIISFKNISREYTQNKVVTRALDNISLDIEKGDIFGLIGSSGAGKSTLLRMINALEIPTSGKVYVKGTDINGISAKQLSILRKDIGIIFQDFNLLESKNVFDNVAIPLILKRTPKNEIKARVAELLKFVGLEDKALSLPKELSGGQKQRVGIARALATKPSVLLCDEATSALDPNTTESILDLLQRVNQELNVTIIFVTHTIRVIQKICNKVAILDQGNLVEHGRVIDVFSNPKSEIARTFVETIIPSRIPQGILDELNSYHGYYKLIRIFFYAENATDDVIWQINNKLNVHTNVMFASVTEIQGLVLSIITLQITGNEDDYKKAVDYINSKHISYEEISL
ncbi:D-methionine transport system ATP-binding protein [Succinivibrio dextrinosolvens]|uniref:methionine ABC transporter ATP-binding protein n=1 Tax=Succinivibrio dextrinosolvens TaxID=83771 RepID=UPI0008E908D3|nr:ATP-binding cassette domain-containing protein [Succinivibrio dextrinosolvens]SFS88606.1 D-methionine transport system ATP-binding protein [Succinivibrio dextrinosolvens]